MNAILALLVEDAAASPSLPIRNKILHSNIYNYYSRMQASGERSLALHV